jgi:hypothetical protein
MAVDPASGVVFVLDADASQIVRIEPGADGGFDAAEISTIDLRSVGTSGARGLAFDPSTGHLQLRRGQALQELTPGGEIVETVTCRPSVLSVRRESSSLRAETGRML